MERMVLLVHGIVGVWHLRGMTGNVQIMMAQCTNSPMSDVVMSVLIA